jgi:NAD(P)-dependent dehydrogenase (short-subunit alcohol dehydrogenase family)
VIFLGRDRGAGAEVAARSGGHAIFMPADLALMAGTARLAAEVAHHTDRLDAVVCGAGDLSTVPAWTSEGLERVWPGVVRTGLFRHSTGVPWLVRQLAPVVQRLIGQSAERAAATPAALATEAVSITDGEAAFVGPGLHRRVVPDRASRPDRRAQLWTATDAILAPWIHGYVSP